MSVRSDDGIIEGRVGAESVHREPLERDGTLSEGGSTPNPPEVEFRRPGAVPMSSAAPSDLPTDRLMMQTMIRMMERLTASQEQANEILTRLAASPVDLRHTNGERAVAARSHPVVTTPGTAVVPEAAFPPNVEVEVIENSRGTTSNPSNPTSESPFVPWTTKLTREKAMKIYSGGLKAVVVKEVGDPRFVVAQRTWGRLRRDFPITDADALALIGLCFEGNARTLYEQIANDHAHLDVHALWGRLSDTLYNTQQMDQQRHQYMSARWDYKAETVTEFGLRLRAKAAGLPEVVPDSALYARFVSGLPLRYQVPLSTVVGTFDQGLGVAQRYMDADSQVRKIKEGVRAVSETRTCFKCQNSGHIAKDCPNSRVSQAVRSSGASTEGTTKNWIGPEASPGQK
jgi:Zinc knuckle